MSGLSDSHAAVEIADGYASLDIKLTPLGAYTVLGRPLWELARTVVPVEDVFGAAGAALAERMHDAAGWGSRFDAVERFLLERCAEGPAPSPVVECAWERLCASAGRVRIEALARDLGCSRGYLAARFREQIGLAPKAAARLLRFRHVCTRIERDPGRWADLAYEAGYFDQSHLNRDFRELAGMTPGEFLAHVPPLGARAAEDRHGREEMRFVQD